MVGRLRKLLLSLWFRTITSTIRLTRQNESNKTINIGRSKILGDIITPLSYADNQTLFWLNECWNVKRKIMFFPTFFSFMSWRDPTRVFLFSMHRTNWLTCDWPGPIADSLVKPFSSRKYQCGFGVWSSGSFLSQIPLSMKNATIISSSI